MKKICEWCDNEIVDSKSFMNLWEGKVICYDCLGDVKASIEEALTSKPENVEQKKQIALDKCKDKFGAYITALVRKRIEYETGVYSAGVKAITTESNIDGGMFDKVGEKMKGLAQVLTWIGIITYVIIGMIIMSINENLIFSGIIIMAIGSLLSWISSFVLYGFGQLVENSDKIVKALKK